LYLILDLYSRKIVGWEVHDRDHADHAAHLVRRTALAEGIAALGAKPVAAWRQRLHAQGHDGAGDAQLAGRQTLVLPPARQ
jgi:transposase InsO family protein